MLLVIDSATAACSAALIEPEGLLIDERHEIVGRGHAERLVPMIGELLRGRRPDAILVDCGPGSFTGIRVGLAAAHGLAIGWGVPLSGYSSLPCFPRRVGQRPSEWPCPGTGELFVQISGNDPLQPLYDLRSLPTDEAARRVAPRWGSGSGAEAWSALAMAARWTIAPPRRPAPEALPACARPITPRPRFRP